MATKKVTVSSIDNTTLVVSANLRMADSQIIKGDFAIPKAITRLPTDVHVPVSGKLCTAARFSRVTYRSSSPCVPTSAATWASVRTWYGRVVNVQS